MKKTIFKKKDFNFNKDSGIFILKNTYNNDFNYSDGEKTEKKILSIIKKTIDISYNSEELAKSISDWPTLYYFGIGRANHLETLELTPNLKVLEIGAGCGSITRYLGENFESVDSIEGSLFRSKIARERCRDLKNVNIYCCNLNNLDFEAEYDLIIVNGVLEYSPLFMSGSDSNDSCSNFLKTTKKFLSDSGTVIIAIENKIGLKYWAGCSEDHSGIVFDGINGYPERPNSPITFSRIELVHLLNSCGFFEINFHYCFPDYKFSSTIFSDIKMNKKIFLYNWIDLPFKFYDKNRDYLFHDGLAVKTLFKANLLKEFANSFMVVASPKKTILNKKHTWAVKKISMNRKERFQCITTLKTEPNLLVTKERLNKKHEDEKIKNRFFNIEHKIYESALVNGELLIFRVYEILFKKDYKNELKTLFKKYTDELILNYDTGIKDKKGIPLLRGESIDFIFSNLIVVGDRFVCIDNEWIIKDKIPMDYVLYRCIKRNIEKQTPWITKKIKNENRFRINLIKSIFPAYNRKRDNYNFELEKQFQNLVSLNYDKALKLRYFNKIKNSKFVNTIFEKLPEEIKFKIKKILIE